MEGAIDDDLDEEEFTSNENVFYVDDGYTFTPLYVQSFNPRSL